MPKLPRRTDADYIRFPPFYVFKSVPHHSSTGALWVLAWYLLAILGAAALILVAGFFLLRFV